MSLKPELKVSLITESPSPFSSVNKIFLKKKSHNFIKGSGYGDIETSVATADGFVVDKYTFKLNAVEAQFDEKDLTQPIKFNTLFNSKKNFKECHVTFTPTHVRIT